MKKVVKNVETVACHVVNVKIMKNKTTSINKIVPHPEFGTVEFNRITNRQLSVLNDYLEIKNALEKLNSLKKSHGNDFEFGQKVREILKKLNEIT